MIYNINDRPPFGKLLLFSFQLVLSVFVATVLIARICNVDVAAGLIGAGLATVVYLVATQFKSPMFVSNSGAFVSPVIAAYALGGAAAVFIGGVTTCAVYCIMALIFSKISVDNIYKVFPKALIGAVTVVIGINLMPFILTYVQVGGITSMWGVSVALVTMLAVAIISHYAKGLMKILPFLLGTLVGYIYAIILTLTGAYEVVDFSVFEGVKLFAKPDFAFMHFSGVPTGTVVSVVILFAAYTLSAAMELLSDHAALGNIIGVDLYRKPGLSKLFLGEGLGNLMGTAFGGLGICSYGEGVATVGFSRVSSTIVTFVAALMLVILGFIGPVQAFIMSIPNCVFAGCAIILYGFIACSGIKMLQQVDLNKQKNLIIVSVVLSLGISGIVVGGSAISFSATALALIAGVILNLILRGESA